MILSPGRGGVYFREMGDVLKKAGDFLRRNRRHVATVALLAGFAFDFVAYKVIDLTWAELVLLAHVVLFAGSLIVIELPRQAERAESKPYRFFIEWMPVVTQWAAGATLKGFLVLYFASGSLYASWPFFALVLLTVLANEFLTLERSRLPFQTSLLFVDLVLFFALAVPLAMHAIGVPEFLIAVVLAALTFFVYTLIASALTPSFRALSGVISGAAALACALMLGMYFTDLLPPIPLASRAAGFYHFVQRSGDVYLATDEPRSWYGRFFDIDGIDLHLAPGESAYFYASIFAPALLNTDIVHRWEMFDAATGKWVTENTLSFSIIGGRPDGYRAYSFIPDAAPGTYRVSVETSRGQVIARAYVHVDRVADAVPLSTLTLQ